jgi:hypothetical protein
MFVVRPRRSGVSTRWMVAPQVSIEIVTRPLVNV